MIRKNRQQKLKMNYGSHPLLEKHFPSYFLSPAICFLVSRHKVLSDLVCLPQENTHFLPTSKQTEKFTCYLAFPESAHQDASNGGIHCTTAPISEEKQ